MKKNEENKKREIEKRKNGKKKNHKEKEGTAGKPDTPSLYSLCCGVRSLAATAGAASGISTLEV